MSACLMAGAAMLTLAAGNGFTLEWTHSVERQAWRETWVVTPQHRLKLTEAAVKGSGAGMEPGPGGHFEEGWWVWSPDLPAIAALSLAASGATPSAWRLCAARCIDLGAAPGQPVGVTAMPCPGAG
ncbi:DUF1850 domain-containing protein [Mangrovicoccus algicola]|uniref:DUF1850 domain-containing protein n=1 Tax=Mangrovicoccus algicola TaxID=2771008 RepID=A0A8J7CIT0_9RHOB|nr:DUF1850 domain-containing protein [Mangrovicoccus algicola]MBE3639975.1 DUF1850 domain-containing protein [Mangrovicoccus algicola]